MMTGVAIFLAVFFTVLYLGVAFVTFISIELITFMACMLVGRKDDDDTLKSLLFSIFWPIAIPFAIFMMVLDFFWQLFKEGCGWISRL